ncbi:hypothetical protein NCS52_01473100 [Fusarium sp. LHS14.1]|nr:hypothetical protein NCS52_01473100 [Fusarium sp. LHS14.1]
MSTSPPPPQACLLSLPRELRSLIYHFYFKLEGGYVFDREDPYNGKLAMADGQPINLSLMCYDDRLHSLFQPATTYALDVFSQKDPAKFKELADVAPGCFEPHEFDSLRLDPWAIPSSAELARIGRKLHDEEVWQALQRWRYPLDEEAVLRVHGRGHPRLQGSETRRYQSTNVCYREAYHFSAAAVAIRFLERLSPAQRLNLQHIVLHEDHVSVGLPECHAMGLIRFCREYPRLRVERYVGLWRNILHDYQGPSLDGMPEVADDLTKGERRCEIGDRDLGRILSSWFGEALALMDAGMPAGSFTLILDGNPAINLSSEIFQNCIRRSIATEQAFRRCFDKHLSDAENDHRVGYIRMGDWAPNHLLDGMGHLDNQASVIRCNFNIGTPWDVDKMVEERRQWSVERWQDDLSRADHGGYCTLAPPLPCWSSFQLDIFEQKIVPKPAETKDDEDGVGT